jgi:hypothetical protein
MRLGSARFSLESAYVINKRSPNNDMWEKPTTTIRKSRGNRVEYDATRKADRTVVVSTPRPRVHATATRGGMTSTTHRVMDYMEAGKIIAAAEKISYGHTQWARFCYDPLHEIECAKFLSKALFCAWASSNQRKVRLDKHETYQQLADLCLIDARHRIIAGRPKFQVLDICKHLGYRNADCANWYRGLSGHYKRMYEILDAMDKQVLAPVASTVSKMRYLDENT